MRWFNNFQNNRSAWQTFIILFIGFVLLQVAGVYVANIYTSRSQHTVSRSQLSQDLVHTIRLINLIPEATLEKHIKLLTNRGIHRLTIADAPLKSGPIIQDTKGKSLRQFANKYYYNFQVSYQLKNGKWVIMRGGVRRDSFLLTGFILSELLLFLIVIAFCFWIAQRLALPVGKLSQAVRRFGVDVQAPPMAEQGASDMREVIKAFNEMQGRIRRLIMDRTQMLAAISHDLRTPITRLQLRTEYLKGSEHYDKAVDDLNEMERMIASILSFARDYVQTEQMERFDLVALLENICNELEDTGLQVSFESEQKRLPYFGRLTALKRALSNLIENAVKYGDKVEVVLNQEANQVKVKIRDHGPGIPDAEMEKVFAPFYRVDPSRTPDKSGTGLGLATARDIIRAHGGEITLHNHEDGGLLVLVTLPNEDDSIE